MILRDAGQEIKEKTAPRDRAANALRPGEVAADFTLKNQIPLNPPVLKGDFSTPLWKRGAGGWSWPGLNRRGFMPV
jgi:hypothetical protein